MTVRDAFPPLRELPAMFCAYALLPALAYALFRNDDFRALFFDAMEHALFWKIVCAGILAFLAAIAYLIYRDWKEPLT